jgi:alkanesulfonate monooxygenase SsuD/methylene tetrahydromethanopterin reductase-like flavin-dependent oxidoreductase (luciferase family)
MTPSSMRGLLMAGMKPFPELTYEELLAEGYVVVGSPDTVTARLGELHDELGFGQLIGLFAIGDISHERMTRSMELFASDVMPVLRPLGVAETAAATS